MAKVITDEQKHEIQEMLARARVAMDQIKDYDQARVDKLCQAIGWALANEVTFTRLAKMSIDESGLGDFETRVGKRMKIYGILRDILRQKSMGIIEEIPEKGIVKYAKPVGVIASLVPVTNAALTEVGRLAGQGVRRAVEGGAASGGFIQAGGVHRLQPSSVDPDRRAIGRGDNRGDFGERAVAHTGTAKFAWHRDAPQAARNEGVEFGPRQPSLTVAQRGLRCELRRKAAGHLQRLVIVSDQIRGARRMRMQFARQWGRRNTVARFYGKIEAHVQFHE